MDKRLLLVFFAAALLLVPFVAAADTLIEVKTLREHKVTIIILDPNQIYYLIDSYHLLANEKGETSATYSGTADKINIRVQIFEPDKPVEMLETFGPFDVGKTIFLQLIPDNVSSGYKEELISAAAEIVNSTENLSESAGNTSVQSGNQSADVKNTSKSISGNVVSEGWKFEIPSWVYWVVIAIIVLIALIILIKKIIMPAIARRNSYSSGPTLRPYKPDRTERQLMDAEKKLREAQVEINRIRNRDKISEAERKVEEDKKALERLKRGL